MRFTASTANPVFSPQLALGGVLAWPGAGIVSRSRRRAQSAPRACGDFSLCNVSSVVGGKCSRPAASSGRGAYSGVCQCEFVGIGTRRSHRDLDAAHRDADLCADLAAIGALRRQLSDKSASTGSWRSVS